MVGVDRRLSRCHPLLLSNEDGRNRLGTSGCLCNIPWNLTGEEAISASLTMPVLTAITHRTLSPLVDSPPGTA